MKKKGLIIGGTAVLLLLIAALVTKSGFWKKEEQPLVVLGTASDNRTKDPKQEIIPEQEITADENIPVFLDIERETYSLEEKEIPYKIRNETGETIQAANEPRLERQTEKGWEEVPSDPVFCGLIQPIEEEKEEALILEWYSSLVPGTYRLCFEITGEQISPFVLTKEFNLTM